MTTPAHQLLAQAPSSWRRAPKTAHFVLVVGAGLAMAEIFRLKSKAHAATAARVVKIFKCVEESQSSMMDAEDEHNRMGTAFGLRDRIGQPGTPAAE
jgi:hypothetical protein